MTDLEALRTIHPNHGRAWRKSDLRTLRKQFNSEVDLSEISTILGRSHNSLLFCLCELGLLEQDLGSFSKDDGSTYQRQEFSATMVK